MHNVLQIWTFFFILSSFGRFTFSLLVFLMRFAPSSPRSLIVKTWRAERDLKRRCIHKFLKKLRRCRLISHKSLSLSLSLLIIMTEGFVSTKIDLELRHCVDCWFNSSLPWFRWELQAKFIKRKAEPERHGDEETFNHVKNLTLHNSQWFLSLSLIVFVLGVTAHKFSPPPLLIVALSLP